ncbi:MAG: ABC transporter permease [Clostridiales bacterium]|nr:ABC transporter permease [Clostridiales bacterium]
MKKARTSQLIAIFKFEYAGYLQKRAFLMMTVVFALLGIFANLLAGRGMGGGFSFFRFAEFYQKPVHAAFSLGPAALAEGAEDIITPDYLRKYTHGNYIWKYVEGADEESAENMVKKGDYKIFVYYDASRSESQDEKSYASGLRQLSLYQDTDPTTSASAEITARIENAFTAALRENYIKTLPDSAQPAAQRAVDLRAGAALKQVADTKSTGFVLAYGLIFLLYITISSHSHFAANSVIAEKTSRAAELLISSVNPASLMFGKVFAAAAAAFTQFGIVAAASAPVAARNFYLLGEQAKNAAAAGGRQASPARLISMEQAFSPHLWVSFALFFILGYFMYAFFFAAAASVVKRAEDAGSVTMLPTVVLLFGFTVSVFGSMSGADSTIMRVFTFIPFFSPMVTFARQCMGVARAPEVLTAMALDFAGVILMGLAGAKIYQAGVTLQGKTFSPKDIAALFTKKT